MTFKGNVYWKDQCKFCKGHMLCRYRRAVDLLMARLRVIELETQDCYGSLAFWCDYYQEDAEVVKEASEKETAVNAWYVASEPIVRCRECIHYKPDPNPIDPGWPMWCEDTGRDLVQPDGFCAWGERRDNGEAS